ncbi:MAG: AbrB/MazE/SpoVT family DNA-binding domain-containing protein [Deltaproteobacteria bacterium]|nr:AbrB/MazE/SpoVT family DNA-binding domain-containing protein [Deltaproteobacteria bacterium]
MLVTIDKRGSINLPALIRKELGIKSGSHLEISVEAGGAITLYPVKIYRTIKLGESGLLKLQEARKSEKCKLPDWFIEDVSNAGTNSE